MLKELVANFLKDEKPCIFSEITDTTVIISPLMSETKDGAVQITDNAVEDGTIISDHVFKEPETIDIKAILSDNNSLLGKAADSIKSAIGVSTDTMSVEEKIDLLEYWRDTGEVVTYSGPVFSGMISKGYDITASSMVITNISTTRSDATGSAIDVSISLRKIKIAQAMMKNSKLPTAAKTTTKKGESSTKTEKVETKKSSILSNMFR